MPRPKPAPAPGPWDVLRVLRVKDGYKLADLARAAGMSLPYLSELESGRRRPNERVINRLAAVLDVPISVLTPDYLRLSELPRPTAEDLAADPIGA